MIDHTKREVILALSELEYKVLHDLAEKKDLNPSNLMRQALRIYQLVDVRVGQGYQMEFKDESGTLYPTFSKLADVVKKEAPDEKRVD